MTQINHDNINIHCNCLLRGLRCVKVYFRMFSANFIILLNSQLIRLPLSCLYDSKYYQVAMHTSESFLSQFKRSFLVKVTIENDFTCLRVFIVDFNPTVGLLGGRLKKINF